MSLSLRPAGPGDDAALWAMLEPVFRAGETYCVPRDVSRAEALAFWRDPPHAAFLAEEGGAALGSYYLMANQRGGGDHVANAGFVTAPGAEGRGVARAMLADAMDRARGQGFRAMQFNFVVASNIRAVATWERAGFAVIGRIPEAFRHPRLGLVDALVMHRRL